MPNIIRIKRSTGSTAPTQLKNAELAYAEGNNIFYIGRGTQPGTDIATEIVKIGGAGAFLTLDTNQTPTGTKTFSTTTLKITGGSNGQVLSTNGSGDISWSTNAANSYSSIAADDTTINASGATTLRITGSPSTAISTSALVASGVHNLSINLNSASTIAPGVVQLSSAINSTDQSTAATPKAVKEAYDLANAALPKAGGTLTGALTLSADPTSALHAATKQYVDNLAIGLDVKASVRVATTAVLPGGAGTYNNSTGTLTGGSSAALGTVDSVSNLAVGNRILIKNQANAVHNGIYTVTNLGNGVTQAFILTRATDADSSSEISPGMFVFVEEGTRNGDSGFVLTTNGSITLGTSELNFTQFSGAGQITAGAGLEKSENTLNIGTANTGRIVVNADNIDLATVTQTDNDTGTAGINFVQSITKDSYGRISGRVLADVRTASTSQTGIVQLSSTINTDTDKAATPSAVNTVKTTADGALQRSGGTMTGKLSLADATTSLVSINIGAGSSDPAVLAAGDFWNNGGFIKLYNGINTKTVAFTDSNITGNAANVTGTVAVANGGTGATTLTGILKGNGTSAFTAATAGTDYVVAGTTTVGKVTFANATTSIASMNLGAGTADPAAPVNGDFWNNGGTLKFYYGSTKTVLLDDATLDGGSFS